MNKDKDYFILAYKNRVLYIDEFLRIEYRSGKLYFIYMTPDEKDKSFSICLENKRYIRWMTRLNLVERLFRLEPRAIIRMNENEFLISYKGALWLINCLHRTKELFYEYAQGTRNPIYICEYMRDGSKEWVFGDYGGHDRDGNVGIYQISNKVVREIAAIPGEDIDHIHRVEYDRFRDCFWVFTGDSDKGSGIWRLPYGEKLLTPFVIGKQTYRACVAFIEEESIIYATDTPLEKNGIYIIDIDQKEVKNMAHLPGSVIFGTKVDIAGRKEYCFATTVEPDASLPSWRYHITYKLGKGIEDRYSHLIIGSQETGFKDVFCLKKDIWPMWLFQFGNIKFPNQHIEGVLYFYSQGCKILRKSSRIKMQTGGIDLDKYSKLL